MFQINDQYIYIYIYIYINNSKNKKHNVFLTNFRILLILSHVCESTNTTCRIYTYTTFKSLC